MNKLLMALPLALLISSCADVTGTSVVLPTRTVSFASDVAPLLEASCVSCHRTGSSSEGVTIGDASGKAVYSYVKANATSIASSVSSGRMPRGGTLSATDRGLIQGWVNQGSLNN